MVLPSAGHLTWGPLLLIVLWVPGAFLLLWVVASWLPAKFGITSTDSDSAQRDGRVATRPHDSPIGSAAWSSAPAMSAVAGSWQGLGTMPRAGRRSKRDGRTVQPREQLPAHATVSFAAEREAAGIDDVLLALDSDLVGLVPVKKRIHEIAALLLVDRARQRFGLAAPRPNLHMCFTGAPGTGKTTVALRMAQLLHRLGYLDRPQLVHAMRDDLVGEYVGQTAPKTKRLLERAMGGVLFIDEAYYLYRAADSKDYGQEAIDILLQVMENDRDKLVVILAGYKDRMDTFFMSNPGMSSRIAHHLDFADYQQEELIAIGRLMLEQARYYLSGEAEAAFRDYLTQRMQEPRFANARSVRNDLELARLRHAHRLASDLDRTWTRDDLMRIEPADIFPALPSRRPPLRHRFGSQGEPE